jgi:hypothetical protein
MKHFKFLRLNALATPNDSGKCISAAARESWEYAE